MMKATASWIDWYVGTGLSADEIADKLTLSGTEVEVQEPVGDDVCFTLEVTSNRTDCLSVIGLARELAACTGKLVAHPKVEYATAGKAKEVSSVEIEKDALEHCPYYTAQVIRNVKVGPSPDWLKKRIEGIGLKPINNVVDVTNFVLFETGQPLHTFDMNKLAGKRIVVRMAKPDEAFRPVVGTTEENPALKLSPDTLVIGDAEKPQAVGGVMGGFNSGVTKETTDVLLESAYFNPQSIKATARRLGLHSDSSYRFERDVDPNGVLLASKRAAALIAELTGGEVLEGMLKAGSADATETELTISEALTARTLGLRVPVEKMVEIFKGLDVEVVKAGDAEVTVKAPSFRRDLQRPIDLVEEIGRVVGLDSIASTLRMPVAIAGPTRRQRVRAILHQAMQGMGFSEALTDTFVDGEPEFAQFSLFAHESVRMEARNPVNANLPSLRRNLLGSLLIALRNNQRQGREHVRLYEVANVWLPGIDGSSSGEREVTAIVGHNYFDVKGAIESLLETLRVPARLEVSPYENNVFNKGGAVVLRLGGKVLGLLGEPTPKACEPYDVEATCAVAELDLNVLVDAWTEAPLFEELPRFPTAERDLAFILSANTTWAEVEKTAREAANATLREVELFDEFTGKQVGAGKKSLAFRLHFRHDERTLQSEEITEQMEAVIAAITKKLGGELRG